MPSRNPLAAAVALSLGLHLGLLFWAPRGWKRVSGEEGRAKLVVSFGTIELPAITARAEASEARPPAERPEPVDLSVVPTEEVPAEPEVPAIPSVPSDNETPGTPVRTAGAAADAKARFLAEVVRRIQRAKRYPAEARRRGQEGAAQVDFVLSAAGEVLSVRIVASSGHPLLDGEAAAMIRRAAPYPRIPEVLDLARMELVLPVVFELKVGG